MTIAAVSSAVVIGLSGHPVRVEVRLSPGLCGLHLTGLPDTTTAGIRDRVRAAILNSGYDWPQEEVTVTVLPSNMPVYGSTLDLAIAVAVLAAHGAISLERLTHTAFLGELGLDGSIRQVRGLSCAVRSLITSGIRSVAIPLGNVSQDIRCAVIGATSLTELVEQLNSDAPATVPTALDPAQGAPLDLTDLPGNHAARHALEVCAAGGHHLLLIGDGPATMLAERLPGILPALDDASLAEVTKIYALTETPWRSRRPPLCEPHHTNTAAAIFGRHTSGQFRPGAVSLAHAGVLFLDQAPEYPRSVLDGLRMPLETGEIVLASWQGTFILPARFQLLLATPPCPCSGGNACQCRPVEQRRYLQRLSRLRDGIEVTAPIDPFDRTAGPGEPSSAIADRVAAARARTAHRLAGTPWRTNAQIPASELRTRYHLDPDALDPLESRLRAGALTPSILTRMLRLAWTLADLRAAHRPTRDDTQHALRLWQGEPA
ncbi:YifB family Mg chelatase-like AAA ATPase [Nonomuraea angiospora]|uniref:YifB family Mg chelatase-like AAA ATPase n=1 Tax=Nonomuraea angiospora TaxID=46172 RepID=UPI0029B4EB6E|nr:ATP-binding protein [Nonomuraea angiospora]MDX3106892.1 ATP-binding protein [Nonomuraea angiospora]